MSKPVVVVTRKLPAAIETRMMELFDARLNAEDKPLSAERIVALCDGADVLVPTVTDAIDSALINALPGSVRLVANFGVGVNHIDLKAAAARALRWPVVVRPNVGGGGAGIRRFDTPAQLAEAAAAGRGMAHIPSRRTRARMPSAIGVARAR